MRKNATLSCEYMFYYKSHLAEMLATGIVDSELAEALLIHEDFSLPDYQKIMASFTPETVTVNKMIANKMCSFQAEQYSVCDESILFNAIELCKNESDAVVTAVHKMQQSQGEKSAISAIIEKLPNKYKELVETSKHPKLMETEYNLALVTTLKDMDYISSYSKKDGYIKVNTKKEH